MRAVKAVLAVMGLVMSWSFGLAQATSAKRTPAFDTVSIRQNTNVNIARAYEVTANGYHGRGVIPALLVMTAFAPEDGKSGLYNPDQIAGMPDWMMRDSYDIEMKVADEDVAAWKRPEVQRAMLQQMLAQRFKLVTHRERREKPVFNMVLLKGEPKFKPAETTDITEIRKQHPGASILPGGAVVAPGAQRGQTLLFGASMGDLWVFLSKAAGRPIEDKTGLTGKFDLTLTLDMTPGPDGERPDPISMLTPALEALGLKLEPAKASIEFLVIDHVERPSEN